MWRGIIFFSIMFAHTAIHAGFLVPMEFPKTAADLSFVDRMALNVAGYEPYESEYDENGMWQPNKQGLGLYHVMEITGIEYKPVRKAKKLF